VICPSDLFRQRHLTLDASDGFASGETVTLFEARNLCFAAGGDDDDFVDAFVYTGFEKKRHIVDHHGSRVLSCSLLRQPGLFSRDSRVDDSFKRAQVGPVSEHNGSQDTAIEGAVGVEDGPTEPFHNLTPGRLARFDDLPRELIGIDYHGAALLEDPGDSALACRDTACKANENHGGRG
jgi:hypothetical protein